MTTLNRLIMGITRTSQSLSIGVTFIFILLGSTTAQAKTPPNVVLIISDDQGWGDYGFMGHETIQTPNLDRLAERGLRFNRGYVGSPLCRPSLASIASGLHPHEHGIVGNDIDPTRGAQRELDNRPIIDAFNARPNLINSLTSAGYLTFQTGKWWEGSWKDAGFTGGMTQAIGSEGGRHGDEGLKIGREGISPIKEFIDIAQEKEKPFFIWYAPFLPHTPHNPPDRLLKKYARPDRPEDEAKYFAMCEWFDETCGELLDYLEEKGMAEDTLVVYVCDNGWRSLSRSDVEVPEEWNQRFSPRSKGSPYEGGIRTPILFSLPDKITPGESEDLAISTDLFPTIAAVCRIEVPDGLSGINLLDKDAREDRKEVFGAAYSIHNMTPGNPEETRQYRWVITRKWKYLLRDHGKDTTKYKYVHLFDQTPAHLYDLEGDPNETKNLIEEYPDIAADLRAKVEEWLPSRRN